MFYVIHLDSDFPSLILIVMKLLLFKVPEISFMGIEWMLQGQASLSL